MLLTDDVNLAGVHRRESSLVPLRGDTCAAVLNDGNVSTVVDSGLDHEGVGNNADVGAETDELDFELTIVLLDSLGQFLGTESGLVEVADDTGLAEFLLVKGVGHVLVDVPAIGAFHAVDEREFLSFFGVAIISGVGIPGDKDCVAVEVVDALDNVADFRLCSRVRKGTVDEVILHVNDNEKFVVHISFELMVCKDNNNF